jgi:hypothetical protein
MVLRWIALDINIPPKRVEVTRYESLTQVRAAAMERGIPLEWLPPFVRDADGSDERPSEDN